MKVWMVFVRVREAKRLVARYIDSQWATEKHARERRKELEDVLQVFGCLGDDTGANVAIYEGSVADAAITNGKPQQP